jgi:hypothetical protein
VAKVDTRILNGHTYRRGWFDHVLSVDMMGCFAVLHMRVDFENNRGRKLNAREPELDFDFDTRVAQDLRLQRRYLSNYFAGKRVLGSAHRML